MMLNNLLFLALFLVTVRGAHHGKAWRSLREDQRGMMVYLQSEKAGEGTVALQVPPDATVDTLVIVAARSGVDLRCRSWRYGDVSLSDHSAPLSDLGVCAEGVISVSPIVWNRETLKELEPIFEAEVVVPDGENQIVYLQRSFEQDVDLEVREVDYDAAAMKVFFQNSHQDWIQDHSQWSEHQRAVIEYLEIYVIVERHICSANALYLSGDLRSHIADIGSENDMIVSLPHQFTLHDYADLDDKPFYTKNSLDNGICEM